jgi:hypothetical protein
MRDLRDRFEALDLLDAPYQWPEIERRAASPDKAKTPTWLHGAWVAAATAAAVLVFAGGIVAGRWLLGAGSVLDAAFGGSGPLQPATPDDVGVLALVVAGASGGLVMLTSALTLLWRWRGRNGQSSNLKTRGEVMETMEETIDKPERTIETVTRNNRWLILAVVVLLAALVALGAWLLIDNVVTSDVEALVEDYMVAYGNNDADVWGSLLTDDFRFVDGNADRTYTGLEAFGANVARNLRLGWEAETLGPVTVTGNWVSVPTLVTFTGLELEGFSVYEIEGDRIKQHIAAFAPKRLP